LEARRTQHSHRILTKARLRIANQPQSSGSNIFHTAYVVPDGEVGDVVVEAIGGEIAAPDVLVDGPVDVVAQDPAGRIEHALRTIVDGRTRFPPEHPTGDLACGCLRRAILPARIVSRGLLPDLQLIELRRLAVLG